MFTVRELLYTQLQNGKLSLCNYVRIERHSSSMLSKTIGDLDKKELNDLYELIDTYSIK